MDQPSPNSVVSHYRLLRRLGAGGMGEVYLADDLTLERKVAIKFLSPSTSLDDRARKRLLREAQAVAALDHPGICAVHEIGTTPDGRDFIVMQYAEGETLANRLTRGRLPPLEALACCAQVAQALAAAHRHAIVHRDLKPHNVIVGPNGRVKLLDFGIATSAATGDAAGDGAATRTQLTEPHVLLGTAPYMSPEQVEHRGVDGRSDLFSLGAVLYECLTGQRAFAGRSTIETCLQVISVDPSQPSSLVPDLTPQHDALCSRLLAKAPEARFQSAEEFLGAVGLLVPGTGTTIPPPPLRGAARAPSRRRMVPLTAAVAAIVAIAAIGLAWRWQAAARLPEAPPNARGWFERGVASLRNGAFSSGQTALGEAIRLFPAYVQAHARLAEARAELDDERGAQAALLRVADLVPDPSRLADDERLRIEALRASVLRDHDVAIARYRALAALAPSDASRWLDLGRAAEAAWRIVEAREHYERARTLDPQYAPAHLRLGILASQDGDRDRALAALDEAARIYRLAADAEGEAQVLLHRGIALNGFGDLAGARTVLEQVRGIATAQRLPVQRLRATFELASVTTSEGRFDEAARMAGNAVTDAASSGYQGLAANGLVDLAEAEALARRYDAAEGHLQRAIAIADDRSATRTAMRARLVLASPRVQQGRDDEAIALATTPLEFFTRAHVPARIADAKVILARAHESLEHYGQASALSDEVLRLAESVGDEAMVAEALENLAGQKTSLGDLSAALALRERIEAIHRTQADHSVLPFDLTNRADLLIRLGRGAEAEALLVDVDRGIAEGREAYLGRRRRVTVLRALRAATEHRLGDVVALAAAAAPRGEAVPDSTAVLARALAEYAHAHLGVGGLGETPLAAWPSEAPGPVTRREVSYWIAAALVTRGHADAAFDLVTRTLADPPVRANPELSWRLATVAVAAATRRQALDRGDTMRSLARDTHRRVVAMLGRDAASYFARRDLGALAPPTAVAAHE